MAGTFEAERAAYNTVPEHVPELIAWGTYKGDPETHFHMCQFVDTYDDIPSAADWAATVARLHTNSMGKSPTGKFAFHVTTHLANVPVNNDWSSSWEALWAKQMASILEQDELLKEPNEELAQL